MGVKQKYSMEIGFIKQDLEQLISGNFYELTGNKASGSVTTIARNIERNFYDLLGKIENDGESVREQLDRIENKNEEK